MRFPSKQFTVLIYIFFKMFQNNNALQYQSRYFIIIPGIEYL